MAAGAPVMRLSHTGELEAAIAIPESLIDRARAALRRVEFWALQASKWRRLARIVAKRRSGDAHLSGALQPHQCAAHVQLGMSLTVRLAERSEQVARCRSCAAVRRRQRSEPLDCRFGERRGDAGPRAHRGYENESVLVVDGVAEGASVIALGAHKLDGRGRKGAGRVS